MNYNESMDFIHNSMKFGSKLGLHNITILLNMLGNPQKNFKTIHVGGTNGKGSTCSFINQTLIEAGYHVGLFISPYLERFSERIQVNNDEILEVDIARITTIVKEKIGTMESQGYHHPTEFEIVTAIGFYYFSEQKIDIGIIEVGLGGRLDATNVIEPIASVITSISYDHMEYLGDTLGEIAFEKCGIIKQNSYVIVYPQLPEVEEVIKNTCEKRKARQIDCSYNDIQIHDTSLNGSIFTIHSENMHLENIHISMLGVHQVYNALTALATISILIYQGYMIHDDDIYRGMENTRWPGRLEIINTNPYILVDGAHNVQGAYVLREAICEYFKNHNIILIVGILADKEVDKMVSVFASFANIVITTIPDNPRALSAEKLSEKFYKYKIETYVANEISVAVEKAFQLCESNDNVIIISGSLYLVGKAKTYFKKRF